MGQHLRGRANSEGIPEVRSPLGMSKVIYFFSSEFGWTVDEILSRTTEELEILLEAGLEIKKETEGPAGRKPVLQASDPEALKRFAAQTGIKIH